MDEIYDKYYEKIYNWSIKKTNNKEDAEDLTNSIFLAIFEYLNTNIKIEKLENLVWKIAYNLWCTKVRKYVKEKKSVVFDEDYSSCYEVEMIDKIIYKEIINNLDNIGLKEKEKKAFQMYYVNDLSVKEISEKMQTREGTIKYYLYSARNKVKERYYG